MNKEEQVNEVIKDISTYSDEQLVHYFKCVLGKQSASQKALFKPLITAIEKERKKRDKIVIKDEE